MSRSSVGLLLPSRDERLLRLRLFTDYGGGGHQKSCTRQDFRARTSDEGFRRFWGRFPISGLGLSLARVCRTFGVNLRIDFLNHPLHLYSTFRTTDSKCQVSSEHQSTMAEQILETYHGNCHCGTFKFSVKLPELKQVHACDCSVCSKVSPAFCFSRKIA